MSTTVHGIHHVTAISGDAQENLDFYAGVLGLRLVKRSVNQDAPDTYHLFYADADGTPGTDLTFFPWPRMAPARLGIGLSVEVTFSISPASIPYWQERLDGHGVHVDTLEQRFGETVLPFTDPHGMRLGLVATDTPIITTAWEQSPVPAEHQLARHAFRAAVGKPVSADGRVLDGQAWLYSAGSEDGWHRFGVDGGGAGKVVDVKELLGSAAAPGAPAAFITWRGGWPIHPRKWQSAPPSQRPGCSPRSRSTASGLSLSISVNRAACCLSWPPTGLVSTTTKTRRTWASS